MSFPTGKVPGSPPPHQAGQASSPTKATATLRNSPRSVSVVKAAKPTMGLRSSTTSTAPKKTDIKTRRAVTHRPGIKASIETVAFNENVTIKPIEHSALSYMQARTKIAVAAMRSIVTIVSTYPNGTEQLKKMGITPKIKAILRKIESNTHKESDIDTIVEVLGKNQQDIVKISEDVNKSSKSTLHESVSDLFITQPGAKESKFESLIRDCANLSALKHAAQEEEETSDKLEKEINLLKAQLSQQKDEIEAKATKDELEKMMTSMPPVSEGAATKVIEELRSQIRVLYEELKELKNTRQDSPDSVTGSTSDDVVHSSTDIENRINTKLDALKQELEQVKSNQKSLLTSPVENQTSTVNRTSEGSADTKALRQRMSQFEQQLKDAQQAIKAVLKKSDTAEKKAALAKKSVAEVNKALQRVQTKSEKSAKELVATQAKLRACEHNIESCKNKQDEIAQDIRQARINQGEIRQAQSTPQRMSQETARTTNSQSTRQRESEKLLALLQKKLHATEKKIIALDRDNQALQEQHNHLRTATEKIQTLPDHGELFSVKAKQADELTRASDQIKGRQVSHVESVNKLTAQTKALSKEAGETQRTVRSPTSTPAMSRGQSTRYEPTLKHQDKYGAEWGKAVNFVKKQASLQLLSDADIVLEALKKRDFDQLPTEPVISIRINGELQELSKSNPEFIRLMQSENIDEYNEVIKKTQDALTLKKKVLKKECGKLEKRSSKATILNIDAALNKLKIQLDKDTKNITSWDDDIKTLKSHFEQTLILEIDNYCVVRKKDKQSDDSV